MVWKLQPTSGELLIEIIKEALEFLGDDKDFQKAENCSASTSSNVSYNFFASYLFVRYISGT